MNDKVRKWKTARLLHLTLTELHSMVVFKPENGERSIKKGVREMSEEKTAPAASGKQAAKMLGFGGFFAMTASMVMTVYAYPNFASSGLHLIFFLILGGIFWFLPVALVAAEMATVKGWEDGGIYAWVGNTLGKRWGSAALFYQWFQITVGFVTWRSSSAAISYIVGWDALYNNPLVMFIGVAIIVWVLTLTQLGGTKLTARIAKIGFFGGVLIPAVVLLTPGRVPGHGRRLAAAL